MQWKRAEGSGWGRSAGTYPAGVGVGVGVGKGVGMEVGPGSETRDQPGRRVQQPEQLQGLVLASSWAQDVS